MHVLQEYVTTSKDPPFIHLSSHPYSVYFGDMKELSACASGIRLGSRVITPVLLQVVARLGKEINNKSSVCYWAARNSIPIFCPALTDGSLGDMLYFHSYKSPGLVIDVVGDIRAINDEAIKASPCKTGVIVLGGGALISFCQKPAHISACLAFAGSAPHMADAVKFALSLLQCCTGISAGPVQNANHLSVREGDEAFTAFTPCHGRWRSCAAGNHASLAMWVALQYCWTQA